MAMNNANVITGSEPTSPGDVEVTNGADRLTRFILFSHEFPSGDVQDLFRRLHRFSKLPRHPLLAHFLHECTSVLRQEVQKLPRPLRDSVPPFHHVITLASHWKELKDGPLGGTWEGAFVCIYEMAMLIGSVFPQRALLVFVLC
ncbi:uncharacterized protein BCR38DRAFT_8694 [Pseudomassariella vexata]|uniref:Starter acyltransferase (SAT) domain-containing protein n=1 Tax=Pseudomassariella vexata TaxID=1141098 RepID=A0A1Y2EIF7_9PEZI|nr:uncharacterized protein BCR38DRAFT_8694 [Pseudomassariella vexata]ORY71358.1 hypothetical protein BCR38DRAFT_8694 [Pseudomassariella vexata]